MSDITLFRRLARETRPYRAHIAGIFVVSMLAAPLALLTPVPLAIAVDSVIGSHPLPGFVDAVVPAAVTDSKNGVLVLAALMFLTVALLTQAQDLGNTILKTYAGEKLLLNFRGKLFQQSQRLSLAYHDRVGTSDSMYRVQEDAKSLQYIAVESVISFITAFTTLVAMIYVTARIDTQLALVALAVTPPLLLAAAHFRRRMRSQSREVKRLESGALSVVQEVLTGLRVVKAFGQEDREQDRFVDRSGAGMRARIRLSLTEGAYALLVGGIVGLGGSTVLYVGIRGVQQGRITLGELLLVMGYLTQLYAPIKTMARKAGSLQNYLASAERCFTFLDESPEVPERPHAMRIDRADGAIEFRDVWFAYDPERPALKDASFTAAPGTRVGIAGATGAGKTTLMSLLMRFYDPDCGKVLLDGADLRDYRVADVRNQLGIVLQEPVLFSTNIYENIAYARPDATQEEIEAAAAAANVHDFIAGLPDGYATEVGERGMRLSGGERQRISLARAFLKDAPILILDEPTSSVDVATEQVIMEAMERLMSGRTTFMIAHRLSTLEGCDLRLELDRGRIVRRSTGRPSRPRPRRRPGESDHPATAAWLSLGGVAPRTVEALKESKRGRKPGVYRLEGAGPGGSSLIAKRCPRRIAELESMVYEELLPRLPMPMLRYHGSVPDSDRRHWWIFVDDAGDKRLWPAEDEHRRLVASWLANLQIHAGELARRSALPDRGHRHYLVHLLNAREEIERRVRPPLQQSDDTGVLEDLLLLLDAVESRWTELASFCDSQPRTLVHGDLVPKNVRVLGDGRRLGLAIFDWETAGVGMQAPDLAQLLEPQRTWYALRRPSKRIDRFSANPCLDTYRSVLGEAGQTWDEETVRQAAAVGNVLRCLAGIDWTCSKATARWYPVDDFRVYCVWLANAMALAGWSAPGQRLVEA